jgi:hypothetical protein
MLDESTGAIKLLSSDGTVVNPTSDALVPKINNLQAGDFLYSNDGVGFQNVNFETSTISTISSYYGYQEYTYVEQTTLSYQGIIELSGKTIGILNTKIEQNQYVDVDKIICEISVKTPFTIEGGPVDLGLEFTGQASGAIGNIDISFLTATQDSYVVQHSNKTTTGGALPNTLDYDVNKPILYIGLSSPVTIGESGRGDIQITVFYKIRTFGAEYAQ